MHSDAVVNSLGPRLARRVIGRNDQGFMTGSAKMLENPDHRVTDTVDMWEEGFGDDRNAHATKWQHCLSIRLPTGIRGAKFARKAL